MTTKGTTMTSITRRQALQTTGMLMLGGALGRVSSAAAAVELTAVEWGGDVVNAMKQIEAKQDKVTVNWVLHQGGSGAILPKIKATWPRAEFDYVAGWEGSFNGMLKEDWLVPVTTEMVPNLADIPQKIIVKNAKGDWMAVPRAVGGIYFAYRKDICPVEIKSIDDLFDPRLKGKICWPGPTQSMMLQLVALALHAGGNENNMEPGWELMKKLAESGNIGRIAVTDTDFTTSLTSGETVARLLFGAATDRGRQVVPAGAADQAGRHADLPLSKRFRGVPEPAESRGDAGLHQPLPSARR